MTLGRHTEFIYHSSLNPAKKRLIVANDRQHAINILKKCYIEQNTYTVHTDEKGITHFVDPDGEFAWMEQGTTYKPAEGY